MLDKLDHYYENIKDLLPVDLRDKLDKQREDINRHVDEELDAFKSELVAYIHGELQREEQAITAELSAGCAAMADIVRELQDVRNLSAAQVQAASARLQKAQQDFERKCMGYGRTLRQTLVSALKLSGLSIPGLSVIAGVIADQPGSTPSVPAVPATAADQGAPVRPVDPSPFAPLLASQDIGLAQAVGLARLSAWAYLDEGELKGKLASCGANLLKFFRFTEGVKVDTEGFIATSGTQVVIAFRGTEESPADWITDADSGHCQPHWLPIGVHKGFNRALTGVLGDLEAAIKDLPPNCTFWFCGHSLGGALAVLAAAWLKARFAANRIAGIVTLGQPRVGDTAFVNWFQSNGLASRHLRFVNNRDIVPQLPLKIQKYDHEGTYLWFDETQELRSRPPSWIIWMKTLMDAIGDQGWWKKLPKEVLLDHKRDNYVAFIERAYQQGREV